MAKSVTARTSSLCIELEHHSRQVLLKEKNEATVQSPLTEHSVSPEYGGGNHGE
jgi:hypothetical protein